VNHCLYRVDRATHLKVVAIAACAAVVVLGIGLSSRDRSQSQAARATNAGELVMVTDSDAGVVR
jgi:hypothetical protein